MKIWHPGGSTLRFVTALLLLASLASAQSLTTTFLSNNGQAGNMFDISTNGSAVIINDLDVNLDAGTFTVDVWAVTAGGSFAPVHTDATQWTMLGSTVVTSNGANVATNLGLSMGYLVPPVTTVGMYVTVTATTGINYTNGTNGGGIYASDSFLNIHEGIGKGVIAGYPAAFSTTIGGGTLPPSTDSRIWNGTIYYVAQSGLADDVALTAINAPVDSAGCDLLTTTEAITATITNFGSNTVLTGTLVQMDLVVDGGTPITEFFITPSDMALGQSLPYTFTATADLSTPGAHTVDVTVTLSGDLDNSNDTKSKVVNSSSPSSITSFPWSENFDGAAAQNSTVPPAGWEQDTTDGAGTNSDWYMHTGTTTSVNTGPHADHTTGGAGYYAYVEDSAPNYAQVNLISPCLDLSAATSPILQFWMASYNGLPASHPDNNLSVDIITYPGGAITMDVFGPQGSLPGQAATWAANAATEWQQQTVNLAPFVGQTIQLRFRGQSDQTPQYNDIAIDDVTVFEPAPTPGQAPRPNIAVMDIENAVNTNFAGVASGLGGPYFTSVNQGGSFEFSFQGETGQPIAVVYGALNPVSATYPNGIGQFDIGGPGVDPQGIPLNIAVFANAIAWAQGGFNGFPLDALFFTDAAGNCVVSFTMPNFGIPSGAVLSTFQAAITSASAPFVYISNAIEVTIN